MLIFIKLKDFFLSLLQKQKLIMDNVYKHFLKMEERVEMTLWSYRNL